VDRWHARVLRLVVRLTEGHEDAADVAQEVWMRVVRKISRLNDPAAFPHWLYRIAAARCADWVRRQQRDRGLRRAVREESGQSDGGASGGPAAMSDQSDLHRALAQLPRDEHTVLTLFYLDGFPTAEIAEILSVPVGTVKSRLFTAREKLRKIIERS
jgi:RNA polymerase sigma-70 factor (ECF subfamily)